MEPKEKRKLYARTKRRKTTEKQKASKLMIIRIKLIYYYVI
jgi:hypothetical protein